LKEYSGKRMPMPVKRMFENEKFTSSAPYGSIGLGRRMMISVHWFFLTKEVRWSIYR
jgi:hypothetical protein